MMASENQDYNILARVLITFQYGVDNLSTLIPVN